MHINFDKYHGTGNDFVLIDNRGKFFPAGNEEMVRHLCTRRFGIGADGLILIEEHPEAHFRMVYFNSDGREGSMCGNGGRCAVAYAQTLGLVQDGSTTFMAVDGIHEARVQGQQVSLRMQDVQQVEEEAGHFVLDTGSPHWVQVIDQDPEQEELLPLAHQVRYGDRFREKGINVNLLHINEQQLHVRTYERGVEDETWSCGTGVVATAIAATLQQQLNGQQEFRIRTRGGELEVKLQRQADSFTDIWLTGPAVKVFEGEVEV